MSQIIQKLFCLHDLQPHAKKEYRKKMTSQAGKFTVREILICKICGKIKRIEY